jgi:DNA-binding LacI/PurR family transcriptional regulator/AraC-like DNA-binding protein
MAIRPIILYLGGALDDGFVQTMKLTGIRRYAAARRWEVIAISKSRSAPARIPALLEKYRPIGCVVEFFGGDRPFLKPSFFGSVPIVYLDIPGGLQTDLADRAVAVDEDAVARAALRELSAVRPASFAVVEYQKPLSWSVTRAEAFRALATAERRPCRVFPAHRRETSEARAIRLSQWLSALPRPCGVFAVNDEIASQVSAACRAVRLHIPKDISLIGVDNNLKICETSEPTLSSIQIDFERMGYVAARLLAATMTNRAARGMTTAAITANDVALRANDERLSFGGKAVLRHCGKAASSLPPSAARHSAFSASSMAYGGAGLTVASIGPLMVLRRKSTSGRGRHEPRILKAVEMIRAEACDGLTAAKLAARFDCSRRLFNMRFREATGHSVLDEILHVRLEKAFPLLAKTDKPIGAIPDFCGFRSYWALDFLFRTRFKMSMREWRKRNSRVDP